MSAALFLDRDGVVIEWVDYIKDPAHVKLTSGAAELIKQARQKAYKVIVITNQSGIGRGYFTWKEYEAVTERMCELLAEQNTKIDQIYVSPYYEGAVNEEGRKGKELRKPEPGMLLLAEKEHGVDLKTSVLVGDSASDIEAGHRAGLKHLYFLQNERSPQEQPKLKPQWSMKTISHLGEVKLGGDSW